MIGLDGDGDHPSCYLVVLNSYGGHCQWCRGWTPAGARIALLHAVPAHFTFLDGCIRCTRLLSCHRCASLATSRLIPLRRTAPPAATCALLYCWTCRLLPAAARQRRCALRTPLCALPLRTRRTLPPAITRTLPAPPACLAPLPARRRGCSMPSLLRTRTHTPHTHTLHTTHTPHTHYTHTLTHTRCHTTHTLHTLSHLTRWTGWDVVLGWWVGYGYTHGWFQQLFYDRWVFRLHHCWWCSPCCCG